MGEKAPVILIGDDSILARKQLKDTVSGIVGSVDFVEAANGEEAVEKYDQTHPDLVFLDIVMPVKDGIKAVSEIMAKDSSARIIIVSSVGTQEQLKAAIEAGARDFIQKPFRDEQLKQVIEANIGGN